jgi:hypothetical protein
MSRHGLPRIGAGDPIVLLGGVHIGCFELFGGSHVRAIRHLKDKRVALSNTGMLGARSTGCRLVAELARLPVDVVVTRGPQATRAAQQATGMIPIVMSATPDPVQLGFVALHLIDSGETQAHRWIIGEGINNLAVPLCRYSLRHPEPPGLRVPWHLKKPVDRP